MEITPNLNIILPSLEGKIMLNTNGGGSIISPSYLDVNWTSVASQPFHNYWVSVEDADIDRYSNLFITGLFMDSLIIDDEYVISSDYPVNLSTFNMGFSIDGDFSLV